MREISHCPPRGPQQLFGANTSIVVVVIVVDVVVVRRSRGEYNIYVYVIFICIILFYFKFVSRSHLVSLVLFHTTIIIFCSVFQKSVWSSAVTFFLLKIINNDYRVYTRVSMRAHVSVYFLHAWNSKVVKRTGFTRRKVNGWVDNIIIMLYLHTL